MSGTAVLHDCPPAAPAVSGTAQHLVSTDDGARLAVSVRRPWSATTGAPIVLTHGWGGSRTVFDAVAARLIAAGHPVVTWDLRGHGASRPGAEPTSLNRLRDDLITVLDFVDARDVVLGGHSGGGYVAVAYVTDRPDEAAVRLRGLGLFATAAYGMDTPAGELRMFGNPVFQWALNRPAIGRKMIAQMAGPTPPAGVVEQCRRMFGAVSPKTRVDYFRIPCGMDRRAGLSSVVVPTEVLAGRADRIIKPRLGEEIAEALPNARFTGLDGVGHMLPLEAPAAVAEALIGLAR